MGARNLFRWGGVAAIAAGALDALYAILDYLLYPNNGCLLRLQARR
jgi:hypothetical protein